MPARDRPIDSIKELRRLVPAILKEINADAALALRAAANPLLALEELGYALTPEVRAEAEQLVRFPKATRERMQTLEKDVFRLAGERFELASPAAVERVLFEKLKIARAAGAAEAELRAAPPAAKPEAAAAAPTSMFGRDFVDPLGGLAGKHPIMAPLLEYRRLDASEPRLAPPALYERIRRGEVKLPLLRVRGRLKTEPGPE